MTGRADAVRAVSQQFKDRTNAVIEGVMAHLNDDNAKEILGPVLSPLIGRGSLKSIVTFALYADVLRMVRDMVMADGEISDEEIQESLGLLSVLAAGFAKVRKEYASFSQLSSDTARDFLAQYTDDAGLFGHASESTKWAGVELCRNIRILCNDSGPLQAFGTAMAQWAEAIAAADKMTPKESAVLQSLQTMLGGHAPASTVCYAQLPEDRRTITKKIAAECASDPALRSEDNDVRERAAFALGRKLADFEDLSEDAAAVLASLDCDLCLDGITHLSISAAKALIPHARVLSLEGLEAISVGVADALSQHVGRLEGIAAETFYEDAAVFAALRRHPSLAIEPMTDDHMVAILGRKKFNTNGDGFADATSINYQEDEQPYGDLFHDCFRLIRDANGRPIWRIAGEDLPQRGASFKSEVENKTYYLIGSREDVRARLEQLPDRVITAKVARDRLSKGSLDFSHFGDLEAEAARVLWAECDWSQGEALDLSGLRTLSREIVEILSQPKPEDRCDDTIPMLQLNGLKELPADVAEAIGRRWWSMSIRLPSLSSDAAAALSHIYSLGLECESGITLEVAEQLGKAGHFPGGLIITTPRLSPEVARCLAQVDGSLGVEGLVSLDAATAQALATHDGELRISGLPSLAPDAARELATHKSWLILSGVKRISDPVAEALSFHGAELSLPDCGISTTAADILKRHPSFSSLAQ